MSELRRESYCEPTHTQCEAGSRVCDGDVLEYCSFNRIPERFDCSAHGYHGCVDGRCDAPGR